MRRRKKGCADPTLVMTPAPSVPALVRRGSVAVAALGLIACGSDERTGTPPPADGAVHTGGTGGLAPMFPAPGGAPMVGPMPPMVAPMPPMPNPGTGGSGSGGAPMFPPFGSGGAPMFPPFGSGGLLPATGGTGSGGAPMAAPMPPPPPMPAPSPASRKP